MKDFQDRVAVVTGAGSGIGRALTVRLAAEGMSVVLADIDGEALGKVEHAIGAAAVAQVTDVADEAGTAPVLPEKAP